MMVGPSYAQRARHIQNKAVINIDTNAATVSQLKRQVAKLQQELLLARAAMPHATAGMSCASVSQVTAAAEAVTSAAGGAPDTALFMAMQRLAVAEAQNAALARSERAASQQAREATTQYAALAEQLLAAEVERDKWKYAPCHNPPTHLPKRHLRSHESLSSRRKLTPRTGSSTRGVLRAAWRMWRSLQVLEQRGAVTR